MNYVELKLQFAGSASLSLLRAANASLVLAVRKEFTRVPSVLMDNDAFTSHSSFAIEANATRTKSKLNLVLGEQCLYERLVEKRILVEQERIPDIFSKAHLIRAIMS